jgi:hypothetical protein
MEFDALSFEIHFATKVLKKCGPIVVKAIIQNDM